ncbi:hypothetical protein ACQP00_32450 [Dactylosporangium sp. CS-047395]|uniref:hypothetical protein n=1 Tax=Dactylosporangium sp. CS-047395 TaxID=3239936 RepID=UPI003D8E679B
MVAAVYFAGPLVVVILLAFLSKTGRRDRLLPVGYGVLAAIPATTAAWIDAGGRQPRLFETIATLAAVAGTVLLILWMGGTVRTPRVSGWAVAVVAFLATLSAGASVASVTAAAAAAVAGWVAVTATAGTDPRRFLTWTGALLIPLAALLLHHGVHGLVRADPRAGALELGSALAFTMIMVSVYFRPAHPTSRPRAQAIALLAVVAALASSCGTARATAAPAAGPGQRTVTATDTIKRLAAVVGALAEPVGAVPAAVAPR